MILRGSRRISPVEVHSPILLKTSNFCWYSESSLVTGVTPACSAKGFMSTFKLLMVRHHLLAQAFTFGLEAFSVANWLNLISVKSLCEDFVSTASPYHS